jgi:surface protein
MRSQTKPIKARDKDHLKSLIEKEIEQNGATCSLNHIDVSDVTDMARMFYQSEFNGDISQWNTSKVSNMSSMFSQSKFNGDISKWSTSKVKSMVAMFHRSQFNGDISQWDTSSVTDMSWMFTGGVFKGDLRPWHLIENQMLEVFKGSLPNYLAIRKSIEEAEKLHAAFGSKTARVKKVL